MLPYEDVANPGEAASGLASFAGGLPDWKKIFPEVYRVYTSRKKESFL